MCVKVKVRTVRSGALLSQGPLPSPPGPPSTYWGKTRPRELLLVLLYPQGRHHSYGESLPVGTRDIELRLARFPHPTSPKMAAILPCRWGFWTKFGNIGWRVGNQPSTAARKKKLLIKGRDKTTTVISMVIPWYGFKAGESGICSSPTLPLPLPTKKGDIQIPDNSCVSEIPHTGGIVKDDDFIRHPRSSFNILQIYIFL